MRAALIARVSSDGQADEDRLSLPAQLREMREYAERQGWTLTQEYIAPGFSGFLITRIEDIPALAQAVADAEARCFDVLLVHELSRLCRNEEVSQQVINRLIRAGVTLVNLRMSGVDYTTATGRFMYAIESGLASFHSRVQSEHIQKATRERVSRGLQSNGRVPYGYRVEASDAPPAIVEAEAEAVALVYRLWNGGGLTLRQVADRLNAGGYPLAPRQTRTMWYPRLIQYILRNPFYAGDLRHNGRIRRGAQQPIVERAEWEMAQRPRVALSGRSKHPPMLLSRIACCAGCGEFVYQHQVMRRRAEEPVVYRYYREPHGGYYRTEGTCIDAGRTWPARGVDSQAEAVLRALGGDPAWLRYIDRQWRRVPKPVTDRRAELEARIQRVQTEYLRGRMPEARYEAERADAERELAVIPESPQQITFAVERLHGLAQVLDAATPEQANRLAREVFRTVQLNFATRTVAFEPWPELAAIFDLRRAFYMETSQPEPAYTRTNSGIYLPSELGVPA